MTSLCESIGHIWSSWGEPFDKGGVLYQEHYCIRCRLVEYVQVQIR